MSDKQSMTMEQDQTQEQPINQITEGRVWHAVWALSWPTMISMFLATAYMWINRAFVGRGLGAEAVSAVLLGGQALMIVFALISGVTVGTTALVARFTGARSHEESVDAAKQSMILGAIFSFILTIPFVFAARPLLVWMGAEGPVIPLAVSYTIICLFSTLPYFLVLVLASIFRGLGDMKTPLYITGVITVINILADWLLIFGIGPFPRLGVDGAAWAVMISRIVGIGFSFQWILRSPLKDSLSFPWRPHWGWFKRIWRIGAPAVVQGLMYSVGFALLLWVLGKLSDPTLAQAAFSIGVGAEALAYMPGFAFMLAATSLVGQNLGARHTDRAEQGAWICAWQCVAVMSLMAALFYVFAEQFSLLFIKDPEVIALSVSYLRINAISEPFFGAGMVFTGAMQGAGDTKTPTIISFITLWLLRLPLAYLFGITLGGGTVAIWIVMSATTILRGIIMIIVFRRGKWKTVQV